MSSGPARHRSNRRLSRLPMSALLGVSSLSVGGAMANSLQDDFLRAADRGQCIENLVFRKIRYGAAQQAAAIVQAALAAQAQRAPQQKSLGCTGDIAAQAIAAGADPDTVLKATAAGL